MHQKGKPDLEVIDMEMKFKTKYGHKKVILSNKILKFPPTLEGKLSY